MLLKKKSKKDDQLASMPSEPAEKETKKEAKAPSKKGRQLKGVIVSDKMDKTVVVSVDRYKEHSKYKKRYRISKKYKAHDPKNKYKKGQKVIIHESKPISKDKRWKVIKKV